MTWVKIDDTAVLHPKLLDAGPEAVALWLAGLCYCNRAHTDGAIPARHLVTLFPGAWSADDVARLAARLVAVKLWEPAVDGFRVHGYEDHQHEATKEVVEVRRAYERERKAQQRAAARSKRESVPDNVPDMSRWTTQGQGAGQPDGTPAGHATGTLQGTSPDPVPAPRPDPSRPVPQSAESETSSPPAADDAVASPAAPEGRQAASGARGGATKARRGAPTDSLPPERGTGAARALEALRACPTLWAIVARPNALCVAIGGEAYPAVDVAREIFAAEAWLVANPKNRKSDGPRFITGWLTRAQNSAPRAVSLIAPEPAPDPWAEARRKWEQSQGGAA